MDDQIINTEEPTASRLDIKRIIFSSRAAIIFIFLFFLTIFSVGAYYFGKNSDQIIKKIDIFPTSTTKNPTLQPTQYQLSPTPTVQINRLQPCQSDKNCPIIGYTDRECVNLPSDCNTMYAKCINGFCQQTELWKSSCQSDTDCPQGAGPCNIDTGCYQYYCINHTCVWAQNKNSPTKSPSCKSDSDCNVPCEACNNTKCEMVIGCDWISEPSQKCKGTSYLPNGECPDGYYDFGSPLACISNGCFPDIQ